MEHLRVGFIEILVKWVVENSKNCGVGVHLQLRVAILRYPTSLPWSPLGYMDFPAEWAQDIKQLFYDVFDYTVITGNHKYTHKNHPQSGKTNYSNMLDYFSSPRALQVNLFCSVLLWLSFVLMHILDYLNSLALICLRILFSLLLLRYLCNSHYQQGFTFGYPKVSCPVPLWRFPPVMPISLTNCTRNLQDPF